MYILIFRLYKVSKVFLTQVKESLSFIHRGLNICCRVTCPNNADGMANSVDPAQTVPRNSLNWVYSLFTSVCPNI